MESEKVNNEKIKKLDEIISQLKGILNDERNNISNNLLPNDNFKPSSHTINNIRLHYANQEKIFNLQAIFLDLITDLYLKNPKEIFNLLEKNLSNAKEAKGLAAEALRIAQDASGVSPAAAQQEFFNKEYKDLKIPLCSWLTISVYLFIATITAPLYIVDFGFKFITIAEDLKPFLLISTKVVSTFLFASITFWASRMYRYYLNLRRIYKDKVILIKTYTAYLNSTNDEATKNLIKQKVVDVVFSPISVSAPGISNSDISKILEIHKK